jgi:glycosyltransferase involved in cell wall biosynthesis
LRFTPRILLPYTWHNPLFDEAWYRERYADVRAEGVVPERHYRRHGVREMRDPNPYFETGWYLQRNKDVVASGMNPLDHYLLYGACEGRDPGPRFDTRWYLERYPDVGVAHINPLLHYIRRGILEGRSAQGRVAVRYGPGAGSIPNRTASTATRSPRSNGRRNSASKGGPLASVPHERPVALVVDDKFPRPDRDAGSVLMDQYVRLFQGLGYHTHFAAVADTPGSGPYRRALTASGATVLDEREPGSSLSEFLRDEGSRVSVAFLSRVNVGGLYLNDVIHHCRDARTIFLTHDLHFLREGRAAELTGDRAGKFEAARMRELEIYVARMADATIVVSDLEKDLLETVAPGARVHLLPLIQDAIQRVNGFEERSGVAFIGGYRHAPNADAVEFFLDEIWPRVRAELPDVRFHAIGPDLPDHLREREGDGFVATGHAPELRSWFERIRLTVAPIRFGAGVKGKVLQSLAHGVPCVASAIAAEGIPEAAGLVVSEEPEAFADAVVRLHRQRSDWQKHADAGPRWIEANTSSEQGHARLVGLLRELGAPLPKASLTSQPARVHASAGRPVAEAESR